MEINSLFFNNNINFQKKHVANAGVLSSGRSKKVEIYIMDKKSDVSELVDASKDKDWQGNYYLSDILIKEWSYFFKNFNIYTLQSDEGKVLGYGVVDENRKKETRLDYLETAPKVSCYNGTKRDIKCVGQTMLAYLALKSKKKDFVVRHVALRDRTQKFYYTDCGFKRHETHGAILKSKDITKFVRKNSARTGKKIEFID